MTPAELGDRGGALLVLVHAPYLLGILGLGLLIGSGAVGIDVYSGFIWSVTIVAGIVVDAAIIVGIVARPVDRDTAEATGSCRRFCICRGRVPAAYAARSDSWALRRSPRAQ